MKLIDIKNLTFEYFRRDEEGNVEEAVEAVSDVSFDIKPGEFVAIVGQNGSGKSTLAKHINALLLPESGTVIVDDMDITDAGLRLSIRKAAGMVFQNPDNQIVSNIVEEDVAFGPENIGVKTEEIWNRVDLGLDATGMQAYRQKSPNHLSGGQKQRVAIAGVLAMEPKCIIFDEATAMLDPKGRADVVKIARTLQKEKGISIILITHHMDEVLDADRVFVMNKGKLAFAGTPKEIFENEEGLEKCGLMLPAFYQYVSFLQKQEILSKEEASAITNENELVSILMKKYTNRLEYINNIDDSDIVMYNKDNQTLQYLEENTEEATVLSEQLREGIYLNHVGYIYNKGYVDESVALENVNLHVKKGEFLCIIGHTGSGKSTLMQHLNGLYKPTQGAIYFNGMDISDKDFPIKTLRQKVGLVFQYPEYQLFADTVEKDVCFGPLNMGLTRLESQKRAYESIELVGLPDTIYDYSPFQLSGGQKRRVAIAGVLAMQPDFMVLDEPTAGLDPVAAKELLEMLKTLQEKSRIGIVVVSHSMEEVAQYADRIVVMDKGRIQYDGNVFEVFSMEEQLQQMGLEIPVGIRILRKLKQAGFNVDLSKCRMEEICNELQKITK